jgi:hypothetical protein
MDADACAGGAGDGHAYVGGEVDVLESVCVADQDLPAQAHLHSQRRREQRRRGSEPREGVVVRGAGKRGTATQGAGNGVRTQNENGAF